MGMPQKKSKLISYLNKNLGELINVLNTGLPELASDKSMERYAKNNNVSLKSVSE
ncbi:hypothetical protein J8628_15155 [Serratia fonticola]|uniref:hypothetical protein n=1 Tax=Serratia fonticola TaxID=47917 RepID=UPI001AE90375|nr:hypothetical protein [Serratia fonticola]MBP1018255.1 hypothetical protein [Serratia fonticola]